MDTYTNDTLAVLTAAAGGFKGGTACSRCVVIFVSVVSTEQHWSERICQIRSDQMLVFLVPSSKLWVWRGQRGANRLDLVRALLLLGYGAAMPYDDMRLYGCEV